MLETFKDWCLNHTWIVEIIDELLQIFRVNDSKP